MRKEKEVIVIGGGLAGSEAAYYLASRGIKTTLVEMKPKKFTPAHESEHYGELVCSNSLKSNDVYANACGLLKGEMRLLGSMIIEAADNTKVPAGAALAVDREKFSAYVTEKLKACPNLTLVSEEVKKLPDLDPNGNVYTIVATGPLTSEALSEDVLRITGGGLHFYDASAPIVSADSVDMSAAFTGDRYGKGTGDYINCPMSKEEYYAFVDALLSAEKAELHEFEKREIFEGCMPIEVMASRGVDTLRYGTLKPVGVSTNKCSVKIFNAKGEDVSVEYKISSVLGVLRVTPREITIRSESATQVYNRNNPTELVCHKYSLVNSTLADNQYLDVEFKYSQTRIGQRDNEFSVVIYDKNNQDVTSNYTINYIYGKLIVTSD